MNLKKDHLPAAYGGPGWSPRETNLGEEIGHIWAKCGSRSEIGRIKPVLLHRPGQEIDGLGDPNSAQMLASPDADLARRQHAKLASVYRSCGIRVDYVDPEIPTPPNLMFVADLVWMTPEGAIIGRPASSFRAGEEVLVSNRIAQLRIPILSTIVGSGTFECADALWLDPETVLIASGFRTNHSGVEQIRSALKSLKIRVEEIELPAGNMHLMGLLRFIDDDLVMLWKERSSAELNGVLNKYGYKTLDIPDPLECRRGNALNFVTVAPGEVVLPAGNRKMESFLTEQGIICRSVEVCELGKAAGAIGCLTGILERTEG